MACCRAASLAQGPVAAALRRRGAVLLLLRSGVALFVTVLLCLRTGIAFSSSLLYFFFHFMFHAFCSSIRLKGISFEVVSLFHHGCLDDHRCLLLLMLAAALLDDAGTRAEREPNMSATRQIRVLYVYFTCFCRDLVVILTRYPRIGFWRPSLPPGRRAQPAKRFSCAHLSCPGR